MNNKIYCSTGAIVGRMNDFDLDIFINCAEELECEGFEFMVHPQFRERYEKDMQRMERAIKEKKISFPVIHTDKDIGIYLSCTRQGYRERAIETFTFNCDAGKELGCKKAVLHLWGGPPSDRFIENNISLVPLLYEIAQSRDLQLLIENVPCAKGDPLSHWKAIKKVYPDAGFIYDTRFSAFHEQHKAFLESGFFEDGSIAHMHISDYVGPPRDFTSLRPIPHLGQGIAEIDKLLRKVSEIYGGTITLESPEIHTDHTEPDKINKDLRFIKERTRESRAN